MSETKRQFLRFSMVTPLVGMADLGAYFALLQVAGPNPSKFLSYIAGALLGYVLNKYWTFRCREKCGAEAGRYALVQIVVLGVNVFSHGAVLYFWPGQTIWALVAASMTSFFVSFILKKMWVFQPEMSAA